MGENRLVGNIAHISIFFAYTPHFAPMEAPTHLGWDHIPLVTRLITLGDDFL